MTASISSARLDLWPLTPAFLRASLERNLPVAEQLLRVSLPPGWPDGHAALFALRLKQLEEDPTLQPWLLRAMVLLGTSEMVGHIGFHGPPGAECLKPFSPRAAEFGFTVYSSHRRQGYAREASLALMRWAQETHGVTEFVLTIDPANTASYALAAQLGFVRIGSHIDDVDGLEDVLEYRVSDREATFMRSQE